MDSNIQVREQVRRVGLDLVAHHAGDAVAKRVVGDVQEDGQPPQCSDVTEREPIRKYFLFFSIE